MARYNIYKIKEGLVDSLKSHIVDDRHYILSESFSSNGYSISAYFSEAPITDIWWLKQYKLYFPDHLDKGNKSHSAIIIAKKNNSDFGYVIPLGKTHFYIQDYVDLNFGLELAERIADKNQTKMKSLKAFGGRTSKSLVSYNSETNLIFGSSESAEYLKLKVVDKEKWGNSYIHFGTSVQFNSIDLEPDKMGDLLSDIDVALKSSRNFKLPLMKEVDPMTSSVLFSTLAKKISDLDPAVNFLDYELYGVDFVFSQQTHVRLKFKDVYSENFSDLNLSNIAEFARLKNINLEEAIPLMRVQVMLGEESKYTLQLTRMIEYYDDASRTFLFRGKWFLFNQSFMDILHTALDQISVSKFQMSFSEAESKEWAILSENTVCYREKFVIEKIKEELGFLVLDRNLDYLNVANKKYSIEVGDLYDSLTEKIIVVKIGEPHDFSYAFDQAYATLSNIEGHCYVRSDGTSYPVKEMELLLIFKTQRELSDAKDTKSLIFELKLNELQKISQEKNVELKISYSTIL